MEESAIIQVLKRWNMWEKKIDAGIKRPDYVERIYPYFERREVIVIKGMRRCGKSTILKQLMRELVNNGVSKRQILYLNLEDYNFANDLRIGLFDEVLAAYRNYSKNRGKIYFFIDEIQKIEHWERWIRTHYDLNENMQFIITGSSASLLSKELSALLTGRNISFRIMPLSFREFAAFTETKDVSKYLTFGGFPEVVLERDEGRKILLLQQYFEDIVHKDIIDRHSIRNARQVMEIARYLISTSGSKVSLNRLSRVFGISKDTLADYAGYMMDAFLLYEVSFFSYSAKIRHDVTKLPKLYAMDNGMINAVSIKYSENRGRLFENAVLIRLLERNEEVNYWGELKSEVDFIVNKAAINVTATDRIAAREIQGLEDFSGKFRHFRTILVTESTTKGSMIALREFLLGSSL